MPQFRKKPVIISAEQFCENAGGYDPAGVCRCASTECRMWPHVHTPEGAAYRIRYFLQNPDMMEKIGRQGKELVKEKFLLNRHLREYLALFVSLLYPNEDRVELPSKGF